MNSAPSSSDAGRGPKKQVEKWEILNEEWAGRSLPEADIQHDQK